MKPCVDEYYFEVHYNIRWQQMTLIAEVVKQMLTASLGRNSDSELFLTFQPRRGKTGELYARGMSTYWWNQEEKTSNDSGFGPCIQKSRHDLYPHLFSVDKTKEHA